MRVFMPAIGLGVLLMVASANGVTEFGPLITWVMILGTLATVILLGLEEGVDR